MHSIFPFNIKRLNNMTRIMLQLWISFWHLLWPLDRFLLSSAPLETGNSAVAVDPGPLFSHRHCPQLCRSFHHIDSPGAPLVQARMPSRTTTASRLLVVTDPKHHLLLAAEMSSSSGSKLNSPPAHAGLLTTVPCFRWLSLSWTISDSLVHEPTTSRAEPRRARVGSRAASYFSSPRT